MEKYEELEIEVVEFDSEDIITESDFNGEWAYDKQNVERT